MNTDIIKQPCPACGAKPGDPCVGTKTHHKARQRMFYAAALSRWPEPEVVEVRRTSPKSTT